MDAVPNGPQVPDGEEHAAQCGHMIHQLTPDYHLSKTYILVLISMLMRSTVVVI